MTHPFRRATLAAAASLAFAACANAAPAWITIGDAAHALLLQATPAARTLGSAQVRVNVPEIRGSARLVRATEGVHAVEVDDAALEPLSAAVHEKLHRCGGFIQHRSAAEALATLQQLQAPPSQDALVPSYAIDNQATVNALLPQLQSSNILSTIQSLAAFQNRRYNSSHGTNASNWLFQQWNTLNPGTRRDVKVTQFSHPSWPQKSVSFEITGSGNSGETIVIGAHLDSINSAAGSSTAETQRAPGADDDASGVATLSEMIRVLMASGYTPRRNIRFLAYAAEEVGLRGSQELAANQSLRRDKVVGVLQLDMTAYQGDATDLWIFTDYTNAGQNQFLVDLAAAYLPTLTVGYDRCGYACSDHASWFNRGFITSFPFEASDARYNPAIHTTSDTTATFGNQAEHALKFAKLGLAYLLELASDMAPATQQPAAPEAPGASQAPAVPAVRGAR
jgi:leucyl aminopeptidase